MPIHECIIIDKSLYYIKTLSGGNALFRIQNLIAAPAGTVMNPSEFDFTVKYDGSTLSYTATNLETLSTVAGSQLVNLTDLGLTAFVGSPEQPAANDLTKRSATLPSRLVSPRYHSLAFGL